jgi:adenylyltransferase/sulfurtransferase
VGGVLGVVPGLVGLLQATEVLKWITGAGSPLVGRLLLIDALGPTFRTVKIHRDPLCPACGTHQISALEDDPRYCRLPSEPPVDLVPSLTPAELQARRQKGEDLDLVDVREKGEWDLGIIKGARHAPLSSFAEALPSFDGRREVVVYCRSGIRSARVVMQLLALGIPSKNLTGGILRWADEFDPSLPRY